MFDRIIAPIDGSSCAIEATEVAIAFAAERSVGQITFVHVVDPVVVAIAMVGAPTIVEQWLKQLDEQGKQILDEACARAVKAGVRATGIGRRGSPIHEIVECANTANADVIIIGSHGRRGVQGFLIGSVAQGVVVAAQCPVLVVKATKS